MQLLQMGFAGRQNYLKLLNCQSAQKYTKPNMHEAEFAREYKYIEQKRKIKIVIVKIKIKNNSYKLL